MFEIKRIVNYFTTYHKSLVKSDNLYFAISIYYAIIFIFLIILGMLDISMNMYANIFLDLILLTAIYLVYRHTYKNSDICERWPNRKMNMKFFLLFFSLIVSSDMIPMLLIRLINILRGEPNAVIAGTVEYTGTSIDTLVGAILLGPIMEELMFRGLGLSLFNKKDNKLEAIIFTSVTFGLMHQNLPQAICSTISGFVFGYIAVEYGLKYSILFHMLGNAMCFVQYILNIDVLIYIVQSAIIVFWCMNIKKVIIRLKIRLNNEKTYSLKRQIAYFLNPMLLLYELLWIAVIIIRGL